MKEILADIERWRSAKEKIALASVIDTWGSSPRPVGSKMGVSQKGGITGSVSAGCVEGAVVETAMELIKTQQSKLLHYGISDDTALNVGLMCGGKIEIFVRPMHEAIYAEVIQAYHAGKPIAWISVIEGPASILGKEIAMMDNQRIIGDLEGDIKSIAINVGREALNEGKCKRLTFMEPYSFTLFVDVILPAPVLIAIGGVHISIALMEIAKILGYKTVVIDPRKAFLNRERFPNVDEIMQSWPNDAFEKMPLTVSSAVAVLAHDPKIDDPALIAALNSPAFYIGALGSKRSHGLRRERLTEAGFSNEQIDRIEGPIGLNIHAKTAEEIAISIMAAIVQKKNEKFSEKKEFVGNKETC